MKRIAKFGLLLILTVTAGSIFNACHDTVKASETKSVLSSNLSEPGKLKELEPLTQEFKSYWYAGEAEISSFELEQLRYGELRKGTAVQVYVTEPFLSDKQVKADYSREDNIPVLKLNNVKKFLTGIYPYSIMTSTFSPVNQAGHALKVSNSVQEWCGQVYTQLNNRESFEVVSHSYFEGEADRSLRLKKAVLEDEIWNQIRLRPESLPTGTFEAIPSMEYLRLNHREIKSYTVVGNSAVSNGLVNYTLVYPQLGRTLTITYAQEFPHRIEGWTESQSSSSDSKSKTVTSKARRIKSINSAYWRKNSNIDLILRDSLGLP